MWAISAACFCSPGKWEGRSLAEKEVGVEVSGLGKREDVRCLSRRVGE